MLIENLRLAFTSLKANKSRAFLTMLGIIIGISSVIAIMTVGNSLSNSVSSEMQSMGANNITVYVQSRVEGADEKEDGTVFGSVANGEEVSEDDYLTDEMLNAMVNQFPDEIEAISISEYMTQNTMKSEASTSDVYVDVRGVSLGYFLANNKEMIAGKKFNPESVKGAKTVAVVSDTFARDMWGLEPEEAVGKELKVDFYGQAYTFSVVGVYKNETTSMFTSGYSSTDIYVPYTTVQEIKHVKNYYYVDVVAKVGVDADDLANRIKNYLMGYYRNNKAATIESYSMASMISALSSMMGTITLAISVIAGIALLVGGIGVMNIMLVSITERTREIGTRKALGATNGSIRTQFIVEAMIICLIGGAIGVILGITMGFFGAKLLGYPASPSATSIIGSLLFSVAIGVFFGYYPANKAAKMNPIDALRYE